jgi:hypothetical protein
MCPAPGPGMVSAMFQRPLSLLGAATAVVAIGAAPAAASSIVYVKDANVYMLSAGEATAHAVTTDGAGADRYRRPRVAPDGSVWALMAWDLVHFGADGRRLGTIHLTAPKDSHGQELQYVPQWLDLSSDGKRAVWSITNYNCPDDPQQDCWIDGFSGVVDLATGTQVGLQSGLTETSFLDDQHLIGIDEQERGDVRVAPLGGPSTLWYNDRVAFPGDIGTPQQPAVNAARTRYATLRRVEAQGVGVFIYNVTTSGAPSGLATPRPLCVINNVDVVYAAPSWSPDGEAVVVAQNDGVAAYDFSAVATSADCATKGKYQDIAGAGAIEPDWGGAPDTGTPPDDGGGQTPPPPGPPAPPAPTPPGPGPVTTPGPTKPTPKASARLTVAKQKLSAIIKSGLKVKLTNMRAGKTKVVVKAKGKVIGTTTVKVPSGGTVSFKVKLSPSGRKALKRARAATLTITAGGAKATVKVKA